MALTSSDGGVACLCCMDVQSELPKKSTGDSFKGLIIWRRAVEVSLVIYQLTSTFPRSEQFGLTNQLRRAGVSVASNIAEGYGRSSRGEYVVFLGHARGSNFEIQTQLIIAEGLNLGEIELLLRQKHFGRSQSHARGDDRQTP